MHELSLYRSVLGAEFEKLTPVLQRHYDVEPGRTVILEGVMDAWNRFPMLRLAIPFLPRQQKNVPVTATLRGVRDHKGRVCLEWVREFRYVSGVLKSTSLHQPPPRPLVVPSILESFVQRYRPKVGLTLMIDPSAEGNALATVSVGPQYLIGGLRMWKLPGAAHLQVDGAEHTIGGDEIYSEVTVRHPILGRVFGYSGRLKIH